MRISGDHVSCAQHLDHERRVRFQKKWKNSQLLENLNDVDIISIPTSATCKVKTERITLVYVKSRIGIVFGDELRSSLRISHGIKNFIFVVKATLTIITLMPMFARYRAKVEHGILFVKVVNRYFESHQFFSAAPVPKFWRRFYMNQGRENFVLALSCSLGEYFCSRYRNKCLRLTSQT